MAPKGMMEHFEPRRPKMVLYMTHFWDAACAREVARLQRALGEDYDIAVAGYVADPANIPTPEVAGFFYTAEDLRRLGYAQRAELRPYHMILPRFFQQYPDYEQIWMVEYDVRYTGDWAELLRDLARSPADFLATVIQSRPENPDWALWEGFHTGTDELAESRHVKAFTPLMRLSNAAARAVDAAYRAGWAGHYEALWPTAITAAGLSIEEIGGEGSFTPPDRYGRYYTSSRFDPYLSPGSFVFRPSILESEVPPQPPGLWHPVKSAEMSEPIPPEPPPTWRDFAPLQPLRRLRRRLRHGSVTRQK